MGFSFFGEHSQVNPCKRKKKAHSATRSALSFRRAWCQYFRTSKKFVSEPRYQTSRKSLQKRLHTEAFPSTLAILGQFRKKLLTILDCSAPLSTIQSETWLVDTKIREPHLNPLFRMNFPPLVMHLFLREKPGKFIRIGDSDVVRKRVYKSNHVSDWIV